MAYFDRLGPDRFRPTEHVVNGPFVINESSITNAQMTAGPTAW